MMSNQRLQFLFFALLFFPVVLHAYTKGTGMPSKPVLFVENKGQLTDMQHRVRKDIDFRINARGMNVAVGAGMLQYQWNRKATKVEGADTLSFTETYQMDVLLYGANPDAVLVKEEKQSYRENYYLPQCPDGVTAESYGKITYKDIYPHIDWVLYTKGDGLKYDFVVHPGGKVSDIKLRYFGDSVLHLDEQGGLTAYTRYGSVREEAPYVYAVEGEDENTVRKNVSAQFTLEDNELGFETEPYAGTLVIDPTVRWLSYFCGPGDETAYAVACQKENPIALKVYMAGSTVSYTMFATAMLPNMVHQQFNAEPYLNSGLEDGFIAAFNTGGGIEWMTYYGGWNRDEFRSMICDANGEIYLGGNTRSDTGIATTGSWKSVIGGGPATPGHMFLDGMLVKFDIYGKRLWGTYIGGNSWDEVRAIAKDPADNIYLTGLTNSTDTQSIASPGAYKTKDPDLIQDAFLMKFTKDGQRVWGTYYGKDGTYNNGNALVTDWSGNIYMGGGVTRAGYFPDAFLAKFDTDGNPVWADSVWDSTVITAMAIDTTAFVDDSGGYVEDLIYVGGYTIDTLELGTPNGWQPRGSPWPTAGPPEYPFEGFVMAIKSSGERYWGTYLGDTGTDEVSAMQVDRDGALVVVGYSGISDKRIPTAHAEKLIPEGMEGYLVVFNQASKVYGTFFGGNSYDKVNALAINDQNHAYIVGTTASGDLAYRYTGNTAGLYSDTRFGGYDAFMARLDIELIYFSYSFVPNGFPPYQCPGFEYSCPVTARDTNMYPDTVFRADNTFIVQMSDTAGDFSKPIVLSTGNNEVPVWTIPEGTLPGQYALRLISTRPLVISTPFYFLVPPSPKPQISGDSLLCVGDTLKLRFTDTTSGDVKYEWYLPGSTSNPTSNTVIIPEIKSSQSGLYIVKGHIRPECPEYDTMYVAVNPNPVIDGVTNNGPVCAGSELMLNAFADTTGGAVFDWSGPNFGTSGQNVSLPSPQLTDAGMYKVRLTKYGCSSEDSTLVVIDTLPATPEGMSNGPLCHGDTLKLFATSGTPGVSYLWRGPGNFSSTLANPVLLKMNATGSGVYTVTTKLGNCTSVPDSVEVIVPEPVPAPEVSSNSPVKEGDVLRLYATGEPGASYAWVGPDSFASQEQNPLINDVGMSATGVYHVSATVNGCGSSASTTVVINGVSEVYFLMFPNPNDGTFRIKATMDKEQVVPIQVLNAAGQLVYETEITSRRRLLDTEINLPGSLSSGKYHLRLRIDGAYKVIPFVINP